MLGHKTCYSQLVYKVRHESDIKVDSCHMEKTRAINLGEIRLAYDAVCR